MSDAVVEPVEITDPKSVANADNVIDLDEAAGELLQSEEPDQAQEEAPAEAEADASEEDGAENDDALILGESSEEPDVSEEGPDTVPVLIDGEEQQITLDELKQGYSRQQDYTRKTQDLSAQTEAFEQQKQAFSQEVETTRQQFQAQLKILSELGSEPVPPDPSMLDRNSENFDSDRYREEKDLYDIAKQEYDAKVAELRKADERAQEEQKTAHGEWLKAQQAVLLEQWPELGDKDNLPKIERAYSKFMKSRGFSDQEVVGYADHRFRLLVRDAMRWQINQNRKSVAAKKVKGKPKVVRPGTAKPAGQDGADKRAAILEKADKNGSLSIEEAASFLLT